MLLSGGISADEPADLQRILEQINARNAFFDIYTSAVQIASFAPDKKTIVNSYSTYTKGLDNILLMQQAPKKDVGKKILLKQDKIWCYFPQARKAIVMNPRKHAPGNRVYWGRAQSSNPGFIRIADVGNSAVGWCGNAETEICRAEYAAKFKIENGVNPEYYALIKVSDLEEVENLPDDYCMIEELDKVRE